MARPFPDFTSLFSALLILCCVPAGALVSTDSIRTNRDAVEFLSYERGQASAKYSQDYMYTGADGRKSLSAPVVVHRDASIAPVQVAQFTARPAAPRGEAGVKVPALTTSLEAVMAGAKAAMPPAAKAPKAEAEPKAQETKTQESKAKTSSEDRNVFQKIGDWISGAFKTVAGWISDAYTWVKEGLVGRKRPLTPEEISEMRKIYGDNLDYSKIRVVDGSKQGLWGMILTSGGAGVTWGNTIYFPKGRYTFANNSGWMAHEMGHVYQYQTTGWGYVVKSVWGQITKGKSFYEYKLEPGKKFGDYNVEQQAEIIEHYYQIQNGTRSATPAEKAMYEQILAGEGLFQ